VFVFDVLVFNEKFTILPRVFRRATQWHRPCVRGNIRDTVGSRGFNRGVVGKRSGGRGRSWFRSGLRTKLCPIDVIRWVVAPEGARISRRDASRVKSSRAVGWLEAAVPIFCFHPRDRSMAASSCPESLGHGWCSGPVIQQPAYPCPVWPSQSGARRTSLPGGRIGGRWTGCSLSL
jgi:hypothetical protein